MKTPAKTEVLRALHAEVGGIELTGFTGVHKIASLVE